MARVEVPDLHAARSAEERARQGVQRRRVVVPVRHCRILPGRRHPRSYPVAGHPRPHPVSPPRRPIAGGTSRTARFRSVRRDRPTPRGDDARPGHGSADPLRHRPRRRRGVRSATRQAPTTAGRSSTPCHRCGARRIAARSRPSFETSRRRRYSRRCGATGRHRRWRMVSPRSRSTLPPTAMRSRSSFWPTFMPRSTRPKAMAPACVVLTHTPPVFCAGADLKERSAGRVDSTSFVAVDRASRHHAGTGHRRRRRSGPRRRGRPDGSVRSRRRQSVDHVRLHRGAHRSRPGHHHGADPAALRLVEVGRFVPDRRRVRRCNTRSTWA